MKNWIKVSETVFTDSEIPQRIKSDLVNIKLPESFYDFTFTVNKDLEKIYFKKSVKFDEKSIGWKIGFLTRNPIDIICIADSEEIGIVTYADENISPAELQY